MLPGPTNVPERVMNAMLTPIINHRGSEFARLYRSVEDGCKNLFQTTNQVLILSASGTGGVDASISSILGPGDSVVVPVFGEFSSRLAESATYAGADTESPTAELGTAPEPEEVEKAMKKLVKPKALCVVYNETSTGVTWRSLSRLKAIADKYGSLFVVDAISVLGGDELPVDKLGVDICIAGSQKCIAAPPGLVLVSLSDRAKRAMESVKPKSQYLDLGKYLKFAERGETPFTPALPLFFALEEALRIIQEEGMDKTIKRHASCAKAFYSAFEAMGVRPFPNEDNRSHTVLCMRYPPGIDDGKFRTLLDQRFDVLIAGGFGKLKGKTFRVGSMGEINESLVTRTLIAIAQALNHQGYRCDEFNAVSSAWQSFKELGLG
jgi:aspartate aminotransferase-like enzyme